MKLEHDAVWQFQVFRLVQTLWLFNTFPIFTKHSMCGCIDCFEIENCNWDLNAMASNAKLQSKQTLIGSCFTGLC